jgi:uncharacterized repeat protein (TIGR03843 family)
MNDDQHEQNDGSADEQQLTIPEVVDLLRDGELEVKSLLPWSSNYTFLAEVSKDNLVAMAVYKPKRGERPLWDFPTGTLYRREAAAFLLSDALEWNVVPPTVARKGEHGIGMVQLFIEHDPDEHFFTFRDPWPDELTHIALFDVLINNADRKGGHCLRDPQGRIWAIDHGVCFHEEPKLRTVIWEMAGEPIPEALLTDLRRVQSCLWDGQPLRESMNRLLSLREIQALHQRLAELIQSGCFPLPPPERRHVPWPMV